MFLCLYPGSFEGGEVDREYGTQAGAAAGPRMDHLHFIRVAIAGCQCNEGGAVIAVAGLDLVDMRKAGRRFKARVQFKLPAVNHAVVQEAFQAVGGRAVGFDLVALAVEVNTSVIVGGNVDGEHKDIFMQGAVVGFADMSSEVGMRAIRYFFGIAAEYTVDELIGVAGTIGGEDDATDRGFVFLLLPEEIKFAAGDGSGEQLSPRRGGDASS